VAATIAGLIGEKAETHDSGQVRIASVRQHFTPQTYELFLECGNLRKTATEDAVGRSIQCYQHILAVDPNNASAYAAMAASYAALGVDNLPLSRVAAMKAIELDPSLSEAHQALATVKLSYERDMPGADAEFKRAITLNPSNAGAHSHYAMLLVAIGRIPDAIAESKTALELDPFSTGNAVFCGMILFMARQYDQTIEKEKAALELDPHLDRPHYWWGYAYEQKGMYKEAIAEYSKVPNDSHGIFQAARARSLALQGDFKGAEEMKHKVERLSPEDFLWPYDGALLYAALGDKDRAFQAPRRRKPVKATAKRGTACP
jgi:tetratricopeptide (TPR) repeat protein